MLPQGGSWYAVVVNAPAAWLNLEKVLLATTVMTVAATSRLDRSGALT